MHKCQFVCIEFTERFVWREVDSVVCGRSRPTVSVALGSNIGGQGNHGNRMSCTVSEMPSGCRLRGMGSAIQNASSGVERGGNVVAGSGNMIGNTTGGIHVGGVLSTTSALGTTTMATTTTTNSPLPESSAPLQRQQSQKPCCFCWCCCCSCSCLAIKNAEENGPTKRNRGCSDLFLDGEQPALEEIRSWGKSFDTLMKSSSGRKIFREFLRCEYSEENILFWLACEELKRESSAEAIEEKARLIYEDYISILSPKEVSLDSRVREIVNRNMVEPTPNTFDEAQIQIYTLMHRDSYPRFINSQIFKSLAQLQDSLSTAGSTNESPT